MHIAALILCMLSSSITSELVSQVLIQQQIIHNYHLNWDNLQKDAKRQTTD